APISASAGDIEMNVEQGQAQASEGGSGAMSAVEKRDDTLQDPRCGFQIVRRHFSRDTPEVVEDICGIPQDTLLEVAQGLCDNSGAHSGWWVAYPTYAVSLLKAYFGENATKDNDDCYGLLPRPTGDHSHMTTVADMAAGGVRGYFLMGENPTVGSMHGALHRKAMRELDWLVVRDFAPTESAEFWRDGPEFARGEVRPEDVKTEVFFFPCAA